MKLVMIAITAALVGSGTQALACSPPRYQYTYQQMELGRLLEDQKVTDKIHALAGESGIVTSIVDTQESFKITISTGCSFTATPQYSGGDGGMCPSLDGFKLSKET